MDGYNSYFLTVVTEYLAGINPREEGFLLAHVWRRYYLHGKEGDPG